MYRQEGGHGTMHHGHPHLLDGQVRALLPLRTRREAGGGRHLDEGMRHVARVVDCQADGKDEVDDGHLSRIVRSK